MCARIIWCKEAESRSKTESTEEKRDHFNSKLILAELWAELWYPAGIQCSYGNKMTTVLSGTYQNQKLRHLNGSNERSAARTEFSRVQELWAYSVPVARCTIFLAKLTANASECFLAEDMKNSSHLVVLHLSHYTWLKSEFGKSLKILFLKESFMRCEAIAGDFFFLTWQGAVKLILDSQRKVGWSVYCKPGSCGWSLLPVTKKEYAKYIQFSLSLSVFWKAKDFPGYNSL